MQKRFLRFVTGSDRVPVGGMAEMVRYTISIIKTFPYFISFCGTEFQNYSTQGSARVLT